MRRVLATVALLVAFTAAGQAAEGTSPVDPKRFGDREPDLAYGAYQRGLYVTALNLARPRAEAGDPAAQTLMAEIYGNGLGVKPDPAAAAKWYRLAAEKGVAEAQFRYGLILLDGVVEPKDEKRGAELMKSAADAGNILAAFNYAQWLVSRNPGPGGVSDALVYYLRAADGGLPDAQFAVAEIRSEGTDGHPADEQQALGWLEKAALRGYDTAQVELGTWLVNGRVGKPNYKAGFTWLQHAARQGNIAAAIRVAKLYMNGVGVEPDAIMAAAWAIRAKRAGLNDPELADFMNGLTDEEIRKALAKADSAL
jgi:TPR repeat protein